MMRLALVMAFFLSVSIGFAGEERETVILVDTILPKIGKGWERRADDGNNGVHSWVNFDLRRKPGEVLSFVSWKVPVAIELIGGPVGQASIEMFKSDGSARMSGNQASDPIADMVRYRTLPIIIKSMDLERTIEVIEYTFVYERKGMASKTMGHGYCFVVEETATFIQHTAPHPIGSQLAYDMAVGCMINLLRLSDEVLTLNRGKILRSLD